MDMPPGSTVFMNPKSAYINTDLFLNWLKNHFVPRKPPGKVILVLDGHSCHCNSVQMLEYAEDNGIILLCLPSHTTQFLQPLDRSFFKSLKSYFHAACNLFIKTNPTRKLNRLTFGKLITEAWSKSASVQNGASGFKACGIHPYNPNVIPDYAFLENSSESTVEVASSVEVNSALDKSGTPRLIGVRQEATSPKKTAVTSRRYPTPIKILENILIPPIPSTSGIMKSKSSMNESSSLSLNAEQQKVSSPKKTVSTIKKFTPSKMLDNISPVPSTSGMIKAKLSSKRVASILNSPQNVAKRKDAEKKINEKQQQKNMRQETKIKSQKRKIVCIKKRKKPACSSSSSEDMDTEVECNDSSDDAEEDETECAGCGEQYQTTSKQEDWLQCVHCSCWFHESCSKFLNLCDKCGRVLAKKRN